MILKAQDDEMAKNKHFLTDFLNKQVGGLMVKATTLKDNSEKLKLLKQPTQFVFDSTGGFNINKFSFKSKLDI